MHKHNIIYRLLFGARADWLDVVVPAVVLSISALLAMLKPVQVAIDQWLP